MTIFLSPAHITALHDSGAVTMSDYVAAVEAAYRDQGLDTFQILPRLDGGDPSPDGVSS